MDKLTIEYLLKGKKYRVYAFDVDSFATTIKVLKQVLNAEAVYCKIGG